MKSAAWTTKFILVGLAFQIYCVPSMAVATGENAMASQNKTLVTVNQLLKEAQDADRADPGRLDRRRKEIKNLIEKHQELRNGWQKRSAPPGAEFGKLGLSLAELTFLVLEMSVPSSMHGWASDLLLTAVNDRDPRRFPLLLELAESPLSSEFVRRGTSISGHFPQDIALKWIGEEFKNNKSVGSRGSEHLFLGFCEKWANDLSPDLREYCFDRVWSAMLPAGFFRSDNWKVLANLIRNAPLLHGKGSR